MSPLTFLDMPPEVKLWVLEKLPAKEIQQARRCCKHFRDLVDTNECAVAAPTVQQEYARLRHEISYATDYKDLDFLEALIRDYQSKRLPLLVDDAPTNMSDTFFNFVNHFIHAKLDEQELELLKNTSGSGLFGALCKAALSLISLHICVHHPSIKPYYAVPQEMIDSPRKFSARIENYFVDIGQWSRIKIWKTEFMNWHRAVLSGALRAADEASQLSATFWPVMAIDHHMSYQHPPNPTPFTSLEVRFESLCSGQTFSRILGIPEMKTSPANHDCTYCLRSRPMYELFKASLPRDDKVEPRSLTFLQKAAVLEDMLLS